MNPYFSLSRHAETREAQLVLPFQSTLNKIQ